jgi:hypothetical protein
MSNIVNVLAPAEGLQNKTADEARAWHVHFSPTDGARGAGWQIHRIREPELRLAISEPIELAQALEQPRAAAGDSALTLIWLPSSAASGLLEEEVQAWLGEGEEREIVRAGIRTVRVAWTSDRCVVYAPAEQFADALDAVLRFTLAKRLTTALEARMLDIWADLDRDVPLSHGVKFWRTRRRRINERTERITRMNAEFLRLQTALEQLDVKLASASKRLYAELVLQGTIYDRLEMMEEPIEFAMNHYELANTRFIELRNAFMDHWLEGAIVALLAAQVFVEVAAH